MERYCKENHLKIQRQTISITTNILLTIEKNFNVLMQISTHTHTHKQQQFSFESFPVFLVDGMVLIYYILYV